MAVFPLGLELIGREEELDRLKSFVHDLQDGPRGFLIRGEAGIGKTTLWRSAVDAARTEGLTVLSTRCVEAELPLALAGLADLVEPRLADVGDRLAEPQRAALAVAIGLEAPADTPSGAIVLPRAFAAFVLALSRDRPTLLAVDDIQWLDPPSLRILSFAARRLGGAPVGILATQRGEADDPLDLLRAVGEDCFEETWLGGLSIGALAHLVRSRLHVRIPRPSFARVHSASGGNPMFALEFARSISERGEHAFGPLPIPPSLEQLVHDRIAAYSPQLRHLLALVATVERPTPSLLAAIDETAASLLDAGLAAGPVVLGEDGIIRFSHPLLASAAYSHLSAEQRRALHRRIAAASRDVEERARHLAIASEGPDAEVARLLDEAALHAKARGVPAAAAEFAEHAVRLTPPPDEADRDERALAVVGYFAEADQLAEAAACLDGVLARVMTGPIRARALLLRATVEDDLEVLGPAVEEALLHVGDDAALRARALLIMSAYQFFREELARSEQSARQALALAERLDDPALLATALTIVAARADRAGRPEPDLFERAIVLAAVHGTLPHWLSPRVRLAECLSRDGDLDGARELLQIELGTSARRGDEFHRGHILQDLVDVELDAGNWRRAERYLDDVCDPGVDRGDVYAEGAIMLRRGRLAALRGESDESRRLLSEAAARGEEMHWAYFEQASRWVLGFLALSLDDPSSAWRALDDIPRTLTRAIRRNREVMPAAADALETLVALGRLEEAEELLVELVDEGRAGNRWAGSAALRSQALLLLARGKAAESIGAANDAAETFEAAGFPLDQGRALLVAGDALRRLGERRRAAEQLETAKAIFVELGAPLWTERAERELRRASPRPRRDRELTSAETRVAALVAAGKKNQEVATQLFTTVATVEAHLTRIYRKLGVRSRTELARGVADGTFSLAED